MHGNTRQYNFTYMYITQKLKYKEKKRINNRHRRQEFWIIKRQNTKNVKYTLVDRSEFKQLIVYQSDCSIMGFLGFTKRVNFSLKVIEYELMLIIAISIYPFLNAYNDQNNLL